MSCCEVSLKCVSDYMYNFVVSILRILLVQQDRMCEDNYHIRLSR